eukprot:9026555-Pyramimonas_sp.AAC.1
MRNRHSRFTHGSAREKRPPNPRTFQQPTRTRCWPDLAARSATRREATMVRRRRRGVAPLSGAPRLAV